ncbi:bis-aminopropyl spermidine synthase family protein [Dyella sp. LX-66]|uniref:bis-aminopropyl spermidine synthase family protein n=1 Tax=unclassified Dyella TaxID=2634549 RepID=UPI001BDFD21E|nr:MULTISPECIES: bis-aminopropyl spermidine synthase family protein [unclassified Dyella]MBT2117792.1 bis-aminopropyl spermidine synthase family protein [Dyella sp. LX-1]MBT2141307.1 bis-aminopropyl spermidine synthase family protein [Dyella sp. LX-66]
MPREIDLKKAINAVSDVVQNRPRPLRIFDQIYMKTGDMVMQSELVSRWAAGKRLAFIGDGDAIGVCVALLKHRGILDSGPTEIKVFDFDERIVRAIRRFSDKERLAETLSSELYNCVDAFPASEIGGFDCFYTNPPWGASNEGESVKVFMQRGFEATGYRGEGMVVIADDHELEWPQRVLASVQRFALENEHYVQKMQSRLHLYHLDDAPDLHSCNLLFKAVPSQSPAPVVISTPLDPSRLDNFYGKGQALRIRYIRERNCVDYGTAHDDEYFIEQMVTGEPA